MNVLISTARNIRHIWNDENKATEPEIEAVLTTYERHVQFAGAGRLSPVERTETIRFTMCVESARRFAEQLTNWADEAEKQGNKLKGLTNETRKDIQTG